MIRSACVLIVIAVVSSPAIAQEKARADENAVTVVVEDEAYVKGPRVLLGEVAKLEGAGSELLADIELVNAARPGSSTRVQAGLIEARIRNAEFAPKNLELSGARMVRATTLSQEIRSELIADDLEKFVLANLPWDSNNAVIDIQPPTYDVTVPEGDFEIVWEKNPSYEFLGATAFQGEVFVDGEPERSVTARVDIEVYTDVVVAATDIPRGRRIQPNDLTLQKQPMSNIVRGAYMEIAPLIGQVARSTIFPGTVITERKVEAPRIVRRNQTVTLVKRSGSLMVTMIAKARDDGRAGEMIPCENPETREQIYGIVQPDGTVAVP